MTVHNFWTREDIKKFKKFEDKIDYVVVNDQPNNLFVINNYDQENIKKNKILDNALIRENFQRNFCYETLKNYHNEAITILNEFKNNDANKALKLLLDYVINRKKWSLKKP